jgi:hypothetical protein
LSRDAMLLGNQVGDRIPRPRSGESRPPLEHLRRNVPALTCRPDDGILAMRMEDCHVALLRGNRRNRGRRRRKGNKGERL